MGHERSESAREQRIMLYKSEEKEDEDEEEEMDSHAPWVAVDKRACTALIVITRLPTNSKTMNYHNGLRVLHVSILCPKCRCSFLNHVVPLLTALWVCIVLVGFVPVQPCVQKLTVETDVLVLFFTVKLASKGSIGCCWRLQWRLCHALVKVCNTCIVITWQHGYLRRWDTWKCCVTTLWWRRWWWWLWCVCAVVVVVCVRVQWWWWWWWWCVCVCVCVCVCMHVCERYVSMLFVCGGDIGACVRVCVCTYRWYYFDQWIYTNTHSISALRQKQGDERSYFHPVFMYNKVYHYTASMTCLAQGLLYNLTNEWVTSAQFHRLT